MSGWIAKLKAAWELKVVRVMMFLSVLTGLQTVWFMLSDKIPFIWYMAGGVAIPVAMQGIRIVWGKAIAKYTATQDALSDE